MSMDLGQVTLPNSQIIDAAIGGARLLAPNLSVPGDTHGSPTALADFARITSPIDTSPTFGSAARQPVSSSVPRRDLLAEAITSSRYRSMNPAELQANAQALVERYQELRPSLASDNRTLTPTEVRTWYDLCDNLVYCFGTLETLDETAPEGMVDDLKLLKLKHELHLLFKQVRRGQLNQSDAERLWAVRKEIYALLKGPMQLRRDQLKFNEKLEQYHDSVSKGQTPSKRVMAALAHYSTELLGIEYERIDGKAIFTNEHADQLQPIDPLAIPLMDEMLFEGIVLEIEKNDAQVVIDNLALATPSFLQTQQTASEFVQALTGRYHLREDIFKRANISEDEIADFLSQMQHAQLVGDVQAAMAENLTFKKMAAVIAMETVQYTDFRLSARTWSTTPRDWIASQPRAITIFSSLIVPLDTKGKGVALDRADARQFLPLVDMGLQEIEDLLSMITAGTREEALRRELEKVAAIEAKKAKGESLSKRESRQRSADKILYDIQGRIDANSGSDWWTRHPELAAYLEAGEQFPVSAYLEDRGLLPTSGREVETIKSLLSSRSDWTTLAERFDDAIRSINGPAVHPIYDRRLAQTKWLLELNAPEAERRNNRIILAMQDRINAMPRDSYPYEVPEGQNVIEAMDPIKGLDHMLLHGLNAQATLALKYGTLIMFHHHGFNTRFVIPAEAFTLDGYIKPEFVAMLPMMPGGGTGHSNVNAMLFSMQSLLPQELLDEQGHSLQAPNGSAARILPFTYDHAGTPGGDRAKDYYKLGNYLEYSNEGVMAWVQSALVHSDQSELYSTVLGRSLGANVVEEINHQINTGAMTPAYDSSITFGAYLFGWSAYALDFLFAVKPGVKAFGVLNQEQIPLILAWDGAFHEGVAEARPFLDGSQTLIDPNAVSGAKVNSWMQDPKPQWSFLGDQMFTRLEAMFAAEEAQGLQFSHPSINGGNPIGLREILGIDWKAFRELRDASEDVDYSEYPYNLRRVMGPNFATLTHYFEGQQQERNTSTPEAPVDWKAMTKPVIHPNPDPNENDYVVDGPEMQALQDYFSGLFEQSSLQDAYAVNLHAKVDEIFALDESHDTGFTHPDLNNGERIYLRELFSNMTWEDYKAISSTATHDYRMSNQTQARLREQPDLYTDRNHYDPTRPNVARAMTRHFEVNDLQPNVFGFDWSSLSENYQAWRAVHDYLGQVREAAGIPNPEVEGLNLYGLKDAEYPVRTEPTGDEKGLVGALDLWPAYAATTGGLFWAGPAGHDPMDGRRTDAPVAAQVAKTVMTQLGRLYTQSRFRPS